MAYFYCKKCKDYFESPEALWHCRYCDHHWLISQTQCKNCRHSIVGNTKALEVDEDVFKAALNSLERELHDVC